MPFEIPVQLACQIGVAVIEKEYAHELLKELRSYPGKYVQTLEVDDLVLIEKV